MNAPALSRRTIVLAALGLLVVLFIAFNFNTGKSYLSTRSENSLLNDIKNSTLGFQQIFVINLESRTDHRDGAALAASFTGLNLTFFNAITDVSRKALPPGGSDLHISNGAFGAWRSHLSVARRMVEENIQSALVIEDDADWDLRIHEQLTQFAQASHLLVQPLEGTKDQFLDPTYHGDLGNKEPQTFVVGEHKVTAPTTSPYGDLDRWDMMWLGHCGTTTPTGNDGLRTPLGRAVILDEQTVPEKQHINIEMGTPSYRDDYPPHTRVVFRTGGNVCTLAYALSLAGAKKMIYELGIRKMDAEIDAELDAYCRGRNDRPMATCLTVGPQYFQHHRPAGPWAAMSEISEMPTHYNKFAFTTNLRWSARVNLPKLVAGETDYIDFFKDGEPATGL